MGFRAWLKLIIEHLIKSESLAWMLSSRLAATVCEQRRNFAKSKVLEKSIKNFAGGKTKQGEGPTCDWYKMGGDPIKFKTCEEVTKNSKNGKSFSIQFHG